MYLTVSKKHLDKIKETVSQKWVMEKYQEFNKAFEANEIPKFLDENPDFAQVLLNLANTGEIQIHDDE